ncbi:unnamed protein product [Chrysoparadoxa australica]
MKASLTCGLAICLILQAAHGFAGLRSAPQEQRLEDKLFQAVSAVGGRSSSSKQQQQEIESAISALEAAGGILRPACSPTVNGRWRLLYTLQGGDRASASPIQKGFVGVKGFGIYQNIDLTGQVPSVTNVVDFGEKVGALEVQAVASTVDRPLAGFTPRAGDGKIFGIPLFGVSETKPPKDPAARIDFKFDQAGFDLIPLPISIPYPVPFRLLGDDVKGWIDITYLSPRLRLSRGDTGTTFVLQKEE